ncbi:MAG: hypothetical protein WDM77_01100 [Steroidobacteraceae bacterium]
MKYRHSFHAGNFADVHKHMTLLALIASLQRKDKGFLYLETHAGRGAYDLSESPGSRASRTGLARILAEPVSHRKSRPTAKPSDTGVKSPPTAMPIRAHR